MRVLWVCNIMLPVIAEYIYGKKGFPGGGWMTGFLNGILREPSIELGVCFPFRQGAEPIHGELSEKKIKYYGFIPRIKAIDRYDDGVEEQFNEIVEEFQPDILHIFGTEYVHSLAAVRAFGCPQRTVINIQGLTSIYARHYMADLPYRVQRSFTFRDFLRQDNLYLQQKNMERRGKFEIEAIKGAGHIIGRTDWDRACSMQINPKAKYHFLNETLRDSFYELKWSLEKCEKYSLFASQAGFPIKGVHYVLEAMSLLKRKYPDMTLSVSGMDVTKSNTFRDRLKLSTYGKYLNKLIKQYGLEGRVRFVGYLDEEQMGQQFLKSHVFVSPSTIENESNSISEAKMVGTPVVASYVGGVTNRIIQGEDGFLYQHDAPYMMAYYIQKIFEDNKLALKLSENGRKNAARLLDREKNACRAVEIYYEIYKDQ